MDPGTAATFAGLGGAIAGVAFGWGVAVARAGTRLKVAEGNSIRALEGIGKLPAIVNDVEHAVSKIGSLVTRLEDLAKTVEKKDHSLRSRIHEQNNRLQQHEVRLALLEDRI